MKKWMFLFGLFLNSTCYAGTISISPFISGNDVTIAHLESQRSTLQNVINGNIEGGGQNIRAASITSADLATAINPTTFRNEAFNDWTYSGMLAPTSVSLSSTTTAGVSYVNGFRVETAATAHTYTASKDTYVYINAGGFFEYSEVANGASAPSTPANALLLFKAVTSGTAVTTVTDLRTTSIQITANNSNFATNYRDQAFVSRDSTVNFYIQPGTFAIGNANYTNTAVTSTKSIVTGSNWIEGGYPSGYAGLVFIYGYNNSGTSFDFKFSSADVAYADTSLNTAGIKRYYVNGGTNYRALGWGYLSADVVQLYNTSNFPDSDVHNFVEQFSTTTVTTASNSYVNDSGMAMMRFYSDGIHPTKITYSAGASNDGSNFTNVTLALDGADLAEPDRQILSNSASINKISTYVQWQGILGRGVHSVQGRFKALASSATINNRSISIETVK